VQVQVALGVYLINRDSLIPPAFTPDALHQHLIMPGKTFFGFSSKRESNKAFRLASVD
jgi:hypothetical protein